MNANVVVYYYTLLIYNIFSTYFSFFFDGEGTLNPGHCCNCLEDLNHHDKVHLQLVSWLCLIDCLTQSGYCAYGVVVGNVDGLKPEVYLSNQSSACTRHAWPYTWIKLTPTDWISNVTCEKHIPGLIPAIQVLLARHSRDRV